MKSYDIGFKLVDRLTLIYITSMCDFIRQNVNCNELNICIHKLKKQALMFYNEKKTVHNFDMSHFRGFQDNSSHTFRTQLCSTEHVPDHINIIPVMAVQLSSLFEI